MRIETDLQGYVDEEGRVILPPEVAARHGVKPGERLYVDRRRSGIAFYPSVTQLSKVYVEPTSRCNQECRTCIRHSWSEPLGHMSESTFARIVEGLRSFDPAPSVFFGGFGEPLAHPRIIDMVMQAKGTGATVELITNGMLLTEDVSKALISAGLDVLWVSLDGATPESYADVRLGAALPEVLVNIQTLIELRGAQGIAYLSNNGASPGYLTPDLGVVFVAMRRNIQDLPAVVRLAYRYGATRFMVTNVLPYTPEMCKEAFYSRAQTDQVSSPESRIRMELPKIDFDATTIPSLLEVIAGGHATSLGGAGLAESMNRCPFVDRRSTAIAWDGGLAPCLPLLHDHTSYLSHRERTSMRHIVGNVNDRGLKDIWNDPQYLVLRDRVRRFDFSPRSYRGGCDLSRQNEEDCIGNNFPTCGGCLWTQGIIQCP
jgi:MoaA/NifB/PqqE/SkfB family radical SAM enzyme